MKMQNLAENVTVSDQISFGDVPQLARQGVKILVCNRPDNEAEGQVNFTVIAGLAETCGIKALHLPFTGLDIPDSHIAVFAEQLATKQPIHAYCRTGNRSRNLWQAASHSPSLPSAVKINSAAVRNFDVVIVGAGSGGLATAASILNRRPHLRIAVVDPASEHFYQPGWTLVGGGVLAAASTRRATAAVIPNNVIWVQQAVTDLLPQDNHLALVSGELLHYQQLVLAPGLTLNWAAIAGLSETLGKNGVTSNYAYHLAPYTWELVANFRRGKALFTQPAIPIKCAGAPQQALYLSASHWLKQGVSKDVELHFYNAGNTLFSVKDYVPVLQSYMEKYRAQLHFSHNLVKIDGEQKRAWFKVSDGDDGDALVESDFDMIHVCPPQQPPDFVRHSLLADERGWLDVDRQTLNHKQYPNIWGVGDVINAPNIKTVAAVRKQAPIVAHNICRVLSGLTPDAHYDGFSSCPLMVEHGKIVLAEFGYGGKLLPSCPRWLNAGTAPTRLAWQLQTRFLPTFYWHGMLKGYEWLVSPKVKAPV